MYNVMSMCIAVKVGFLVVLIEERSPYHNIGQAPHSHYHICGARPIPRFLRFHDFLKSCSR